MDYTIPRKKGSLLPSLFVLFAFSFTLPGLFSNLLFGITFLSIYTIFLFIILVKKQSFFRRGPLTNELIISIGYLTINTYGILAFGSASYVNFILFAISIFFFTFSSYLDWNKKVIRFVSGLVIIYVIINLILLLSSGIGQGYFYGIFNNPNIQGAYTLFMSYFLLLVMLDTKLKRIKISIILTLIVMLIMTYLSGSRTILLSIAVILFVYYIFRVISKTKFRFNSFFIIVISLALSFVVIYPGLHKYMWFNKLDLFIYNQTGKHIYTGREVIWSQLVEKINLRPLFGYGPDATASALLNNDLSSHNLFLQIALQSGWIGVGILCIILFVIWGRFRIGQVDKRVRLTASFMIAIIVHQMFEVSLTQNNFVVGIIQWLILAIGTSYALRHKNPKNIDSHLEHTVR